MTVTIARLLPDNAEAFYAVIAANREHLSNMVWAKTATLQSTLNHLKTTRDIMYGIYTAGKLCGCVSLRNIGCDSYLLGYWVAEECQRQGVVTQAARHMIEAYFVGYARKQTIVAMTRAENLASQRVLEKLCFKRQPQFTTDWVNFELEIGT